MKRYTLQAVIDGEIKGFKRKFASRDEAIEYMFNYYSDHYYQNIQVDEEYCVNDNKHDIEYVCDYYNRFRVTRVAA